MKVRFDTDLCEANRVCMEHCPEVFYVDGDDTLTILMPEVPERHQAAVQQAVYRCPRQALRIEE